MHVLLQFLYLRYIMYMHISLWHAYFSLVHQTFIQLVYGFFMQEVNFNVDMETPHCFKRRPAKNNKRESSKEIRCRT
jgi:hypothetical protein